MQYLRVLLAVVICAMFVHGVERPAPDSASARNDALSWQDYIGFSVITLFAVLLIVLRTVYIAKKIKKEAVK